MSKGPSATKPSKRLDTAEKTVTVAGGQDPLTGDALDNYVRERCELFLRIANE